MQECEQGGKTSDIMISGTWLGEVITDTADAGEGFAGWQSCRLQELSL